MIFLRFLPAAAGLLLLLTHCAPKPAAGETTDGAAPGPSAVAELLQPNEPDLDFPVYADFEQLRPLFDRRDDRTYVINFWATWCRPCIAEMPYFERLAAEVAGQPVEIVMVSLDFQRDVRTKLKTFVAERQLPMGVVALTDANYDEWIDRVNPEWGGAIPVTLVYRNDERRFHASEFASYEELRDLVAAVR